MQSEAMKKMEEEERVRQEEEEGAYEVRKIVDFKKDSVSEHSMSKNISQKSLLFFVSCRGAGASS